MTPTQNPYASPQTQPAPPSRLPIDHFPPLRLAGFMIFLMGFIQTVFAVVCAPVFFYLYLIVKNSLPYYSQQEDIMIGRILLITAILALPRGLLLLSGGVSLRNGRRYRLSMTGALLAILGFVLPVFWIEVPFGIWAFLHLRKVAHAAKATKVSP